MSRKRKTLANGDDYYNRHLYGESRQFAGNPQNSNLALVERMYMRVLTELATNRFKWTGLPESIDIRFLEMTLFYQALSVFYFDKDYDKYLALRAGSAGSINLFDNPTSFLVTGNDFIGKTLKSKDCVPIWANYLRVPDLDIVLIYARRLAQMDITIDINVNSARRNKVIVSSENQRLSATNIIRQLDEGQPVINVNTPLNEMVTALDLGIDPKNIETLHIVRTRMWNECMGLLGIDNANQDKTERLVAGEVDANNGQTASSKFVNLNARRAAAHTINIKYNLDVKVDYNTDIADQLESAVPVAPPELEEMSYENEEIE